MATGIANTENAGPQTWLQDTDLLLQELRQHAYRCAGHQPMNEEHLRSCVRQSLSERSAVREEVEGEGRGRGGHRRSSVEGGQGPTRQAALMHRLAGAVMAEVGGRGGRDGGVAIDTLTNMLALEPYPLAVKWLTEFLFAYVSLFGWHSTALTAPAAHVAPLIDSVLCSRPVRAHELHSASLLCLGHFIHHHRSRGRPQDAIIVFSLLAGTPTQHPPPHTQWASDGYLYRYTAQRLTHIEIVSVLVSLGISARCRALLDAAAHYMLAATGAVGLQIAATVATDHFFFAPPNSAQLLASLSPSFCYAVSCVWASAYLSPDKDNREGCPPSHPLSGATSPCRPHLCHHPATMLGSTPGPDLIGSLFGPDTTSRPYSPEPLLKTLKNLAETGSGVLSPAEQEAFKAAFPNIEKALL